MGNKELIDQIWNGEVDCTQCRIRELVLFAHLTAEDFNYIHLPITDVAVERSQTIYKEGKTGNYIYTIRSGLVKLEVKQPDGGEKIVRLLSKGDVTGLEVLIGESYHHTASAIESCRICKIPIEVIDNLRTHSEALCNDLMDRWDRSVNMADEWLVKLNSGQAKQRIIYFLDYLVSISGTAPEFLMPSRDDMSSILDLTRETVSRIIAELRREGCLSFFGNGVYEADLKKLNKLRV